MIILGPALSMNESPWVVSFWAQARRRATLFRLLPGALVIACLGVAGCERSSYATIMMPVNMATYAVGDSVIFRAEVNSNRPLEISEEGDWRWTSDLDGELGGTALFARNDLSMGEHLITLRVQNSAGVVLRDQIRIFIR